MVYLLMFLGLAVLCLAAVYLRLAVRDDQELRDLMSRTSSTRRRMPAPFGVDLASSEQEDTAPAVLDLRLVNGGSKFVARDTQGE